MTKVPDLQIPKYNPIQKISPLVGANFNNNNKTKKEKNRDKHDRLLRLFDGDGYEEFHHPKYVFVKQWNGNQKNWQVAIYPIDSWTKKSPPMPTDWIN